MASPKQSITRRRSPTSICDLHRFVAYLRVSVAKSGGKDSLGIEAQRSAVATHLARVRLSEPSAELLAEYVEVESGRRDDRPELAKALAHARLAGATLVIAKLDRLSRDVHFLTGLEKEGTRFVACDMPNANSLTVHILASVAQHERKMISDRTVAALAEARKRIAKTGQRKHPKIKRLGNPNGALALRRAGRGNAAAVATVQRRADEEAEKLRTAVTALRTDEHGRPRPANAIARAMNDQGFLSRRKGTWTAQTVIRLLVRLDACQRGPSPQDAT
ncbi:recombinase family protein [Bauldia litoralis]|uniref:recombinase family protein n=1 Tax=Bauldia litoralis TaxID=665467 RepID=UPI003267A484